jgi:hypothetical protein
VIVVKDHRTGAPVGIDPKTLKSVEWHVTDEGQKLPKFNLENGYIVSTDGPDEILPQVMRAMPGNEVIVFLSGALFSGRMRQIVSGMLANGWTEARVTALLGLIFAEWDTKKATMGLPDLLNDG